MINEKNGNQIIYGLYGINQSKYEKKKRLQIASELDKTTFHRKKKYKTFVLIHDNASKTKEQWNHEIHYV